MTEHTAPDSKILERIRKLHAKAESAKSIGSLAEAETFAAAVEKMLAKYKLDMAGVELGVLDIQDPLGMEPLRGDDTGMGRRHKRVAWYEDLASAVARAHFCKILIVPRSVTIYFVGRQSDRQVATYMFQILARTAQELCTTAYFKELYKAKQAGHYGTNNFKAGFYEGFVSRIDTRYAEMRRAEVTESSGMALVVQRSGAEVQKWVEDFLGDRKGKSAAELTRGGGGREGWAAGRKAADGVNLSGKSMQEGGEGVRRLGSGS